MKSPFSQNPFEHKPSRDTSSSAPDLLDSLSDPEFIKTFPGPSDMQYAIMREEFLSSPESAKNSLHMLDAVLRDPAKPLYVKLRLADFLRKAIGNVPQRGSHDPLIEELQVGLAAISDDPKTPYFLSVAFSPNIVLSPKQSFATMEQGLTPVRVSETVYVQDNGYDPIPKFYEVSDPKTFDSLVEQQTALFAAARPEHRPDVPRNATFKELSAYKQKYLDAHIHRDERVNELAARRQSVSRVMTLDEVAQYFPHVEQSYDLVSDETMFEFRSFIDPAVRSQMEQDFGIRLNDIPLQEQIYFLTSIAGKTNKDIGNIQAFTRQYGGDGFTAFLSLEHDRSIGEKIIDLGSHLPAAAARQIFAKYAQINDRVSHIDQYLAAVFSKKQPISAGVRESIRRTLSERAAELLEKFHSKMGGGASVPELLADLDRVDADTLMALSAFKNAVRHGVSFPLEDIAGSEFGYVRGDEVSDEQIAEMVSIYRNNWTHYPNQELIQGVITKFEHALAGPGRAKERVYLFKKNDRIRGFVKFSPEQEGVVQASALNVDESAQGFGLGEALMDEALAREAREHILSATCDPFNPSNMRYMEKGFVATGFTGPDSQVFSLVWDESKNADLVSKQMSREAITEALDSGNIPEGLIITRAASLEEAHQSILPGVALTRCFLDSDHGGWITVYEPLSDEYGKVDKKTP